MYYYIKACGERIRQLRIKTGYTQEEAAELLNIDRSFLSRIEAGKKSCSVDLLVHLSSAFHVSLDYLILGKSNSRVEADKDELKSDIDKLIARLEKLKLSL